MSATKQNFCKKGHSMEEYRRYHPNGDSYCSACKADRTKKDRLEKPTQHAHYSWKSRIKKMYGITEKEYTDLFFKQHGTCAICFSDLIFRDKFTHIDHCHETGKIRGLLCHNCNTAIGLLGESEKTMQNAIDYLKKKK